MRPTIGIMPSGLPWAMKFKQRPNVTKKPNRTLRTVERYHKYLYSVPYSDHSCFGEIKEFVKLLNPLNIKGIVSSSPSYVDPLYYFGHFCGENQPSVSLYQNCEDKGVGDKRRKCIIRSDDSAEVGRKKTKHVEFLGVRMSRVSVLRREKRGVKIVEMDSAD